MVAMFGEVVTGQGRPQIFMRGEQILDSSKQRDGSSTTLRSLTWPEMALA